ncbi:MAG: hypothetical protein SNJ55_09610 [Chloroherpetonaceae bacterium]
MKKLFLSLAFAFFSSLFLSATLSAQFISSGKQLATVGIGGFKSATVVGGMWEIGVGDKVGIGRFGVGALGGLYLTGGDNALGVGGQANYHFDLNAPRWDLYAGLNFIAVFAGGSGSDLGFQFGGRYAVQNNLSILVQLGAGGFSTFFAGVSFGL